MVPFTQKVYWAPDLRACLSWRPPSMLPSDARCYSPRARPGGSSPYPQHALPGMGAHQSTAPCAKGLWPTFAAGWHTGRGGPKAEVDNASSLQAQPSTISKADVSPSQRRSRRCTSLRKTCHLSCSNRQVDQTQGMGGWQQRDLPHCMRACTSSP